MILLILVTGCTSLAVPVSTDERSIDLHTLYKTLEKEHKNLYHQTSKEVFRAEYERALLSAPALNDIDFYFTASKLAALASDSHTSVSLTKELVASLNVYPLQIAYVDGAWRLIVVEQDKRSMLGSEILTINGICFTEIVERARPLVSHDNEVWFRQSLSRLLNIAELYQYLGVLENARQEIVITLDKQESYIVEPLTVEEFYQKEYRTLYDVKPITALNPVYYRSLLLDQDSILFLQYNSCASDSEYPIDQFIEDTLQHIARHEINKVIVDLRYNTGGNSRLFEPMIKGLALLQKELNFSIDVLIGDRTFSSAIMNAVQLKQRTEARLVGTETGGSVNHYGELKYFTLPYSSLVVHYSTKYFVMDKKHEEGSLKPDVYIEPAVKDLLDGVDTVVQTILGRVDEQ
ncbi:MAG: hypothetical protein EOM15_01590 [Spirochaetia bacterium]|nr:hypothetical protein [Spirochaetia bacterium]